jgi:CheY-like chemotaxis protein
MTKPVILVIDDDPDMLDVLMLCLADEFMVRTFLDPRQAISGVCSGDYMAILTDLNMPGVNGVHFVKEIRAFNKQIPIILVTGLDPRDQDVSEAVEAGATAVLTKPIRNLDLVSETVRKFIIHDHERRND